MPGPDSRLWWVQAVLAALSGMLALLSLVTHEWIELSFGIDPDRGNGSLEWLVVLVTGTAAVLLSGLARREWRRLHAVVERG